MDIFKSKETLEDKEATTDEFIPQSEVLKIMHKEQGVLIPLEEYVLLRTSMQNMINAFHLKRNAWSLKPTIEVEVDFSCIPEITKALKEKCFRIFGIGVDKYESTLSCTGTFLTNISDEKKSESED